MSVEHDADQPEFEFEEEKQQRDEVLDNQNVEDDTEQEPHTTNRFSITSYGADLSVFDLRRRLGNEILIPAPFQRKFVWSQRQASRFIESILLGLPVPGIFVYLKDKKQLIVDGQQRLITLDRFLSGVWEKRTRKQGGSVVEVSVPFTLLEVADPWAGKTFADLEKDDRDEIENYLIHATIFRQDHPAKKDRSIYEVFERINTGGLRLSNQEIRACISHGSMVQKLDEIAALPQWRSVYGKRSPRLKDEELILRFFALLKRHAAYKRPMRVFLDEYLEDEMDATSASLDEMKAIFLNTLAALTAAIPDKLFRPETALNAAVFDAVMVGCADRVSQGPVEDSAALRVAYLSLLNHEEFQKNYKRATADDESVKSRIRLAIEAFANLK